MGAARSAFGGEGLVRLRSIVGGIPSRGHEPSRVRLSLGLPIRVRDSWPATAMSDVDELYAQLELIPHKDTAHVAVQSQSESNVAPLERLLHGFRS
jgi:hypothetical protein